VFVVDDDVSVRESLELLIRCEGWQPETFASASEFLASPRPSVPSCLVLDVSMPGLNGLELQKRVANDRPDLPIIFVTGHADLPMTVQAMKVLGAIRQAIERSREALSRERETQALRNDYASLSQREREVMALVVTGMSTSKWPTNWGSAKLRSKAHRGRVMQKMKAESLADLVNKAAGLGFARGDRRKAQPKSVTYVLGAFCYPCLRAGHTTESTSGLLSGEKTSPRN
jgi:FixJ family two-component response regulator